jgi:porin
VLLALVVAAALQAQDPQGFWERDTLLGDWGGVRPALADRGVRTTLEFTGEILSNVRGGLSHDTGAQLLLDGVIEADFDRLLGWTGGSGRINPLWLAGDGLTSSIDELTHVSNIEGLGGVRVFEFWLQQALLDGALSVRAGILAADQEFAIADSGVLFANSGFGGPVFLTANLSWPIYPVGAAGLRLRWEPAAKTYVQAAVYDGDPGSEGLNRSGMRVRWNHGEGVFSIAEAGRRFGDQCPVTIKAGAFYHTADFADYDSGHAAPGLAGGYALVEQRVWTDGPLPGALDVFVRVGAAQPQRSFVSLAADAGLNFTGLLPGRPSDVLGLGAIYARVSPDYTGAQPDAARWGYEAVFEAAYKLVLTPAWSFQPDVQVILHPGGTSELPTATVLGIRLNLIF